MQNASSWPVLWGFSLAVPLHFGYHNEEMTMLKNYDYKGNSALLRMQRREKLNDQLARLNGMLLLSLVAVGTVTLVNWLLIARYGV